jgi:hypothetical protein
MVKNSFPSLIHECPYYGRNELKNFKIKWDLTKMLPKGIYFCNFIVLNRNKPILNSTLVYDIY